MRSIVLSLSSAKDRLDTFLQVYPEKIFGKVEVWPTKSGKDVDVPGWWRREPNRYALAVNQMDILNSVDDDVIIWEDDCTFTDNFAKKYKKYIAEVPNDADIIYLGARHFVAPEQISENVLKVHAAYTSQAIIYKKDCTKRFAEYLAEPSWGCKHYPDMRRSQGILSGKFIAYAPLHTLCGQAAGYSDLINKDRKARQYDTFKFYDLNGDLKIMKNGVIQE